MRNRVKKFEAFEPRKVDDRFKDLINKEPFNQEEFQVWFATSDLRRLLVTLSKKRGEQDLFKLADAATQRVKYGSVIETLEFVKKCYLEAKAVGFVRDRVYSAMHYTTYFYAACGFCDAAVQHWIAVLKMGGSVKKLAVGWDSSGDATTVELAGLEKLDSHVSDFLQTVKYLTPEMKQHVIDLVSKL